MVKVMVNVRVMVMSWVIVTGYRYDVGIGRS